MEVMDLWLPIVISAVVVFIASFMAWMVFPHHKKDVLKLPDEAGFVEALKRYDIPAGTYMWPNCVDAAEMKSDEYKQRYKAGPWGSMTVQPGQPNFGLNLALVFVFYLVVGAFVAYITGQARAPGAEYLSVFQVAGASAFAAYCLGGLPNAIFFGRPVRAVFTDFIDGLVYALLTAGIFAWRWPDAVASAAEQLPAGTPGM